MALVGKAGLGGDARRRHAGGQKLARLFDAHVNQVAVRRDAESLRKSPHQVVAAQAAHRGKLVQRQRTRVVLDDEFPAALQAAVARALMP